MLSRSLKPAVLTVVFALTSACGYRFAAGGDPLPEGITQVRSPIFFNHTPESGLETLFTESLRGELMRSGITTRDGADAELQGEVLNVWGGPTIVTTPRKGTNEETTLASYRIFAAVKLKLVKDGRVLKETEISGSEDYLPGEDVLRAETNRQAALHRLADRLMRDGFDQLRVRG